MNQQELDQIYQAVEDYHKNKTDTVIKIDKAKNGFILTLTHEAKGIEIWDEKYIANTPGIASEIVTKHLKDVQEELK